jgi:hypothetical protein
VRPRGREATLVEVRATFNSSVSVPLHPATDVDCVSHGIQESNLLREVLVEASKTHRPDYAKPGGAPQPAASSGGAQSSGPATASSQPRPPSTIDKDEAPPSPPSLSTGGFSLLDRSHPLARPDAPTPPSQ